MNNPVADLLSQTSSFASLGTVLTFVYTFGMLIYWTAVFFILYHLIRFGVSGQPKKIALLFLVGSVMLSLITTLFFIQTIFTA